MFRKIACGFVAVVVLGGATASPARAQGEDDKLYSKEVQKACMEAVVRIYAEGARSAWQGSGACMAYDKESGVAIILTAAHVVKGAKKLSFEVFTSASYPNPARKYTPKYKFWYDEKEDSAIIVAQMWVPRQLKLAKDPAAVRKGDHVFSVGCGIGAPPVTQVADIAGFRNNGDYFIERGGIGGRSGGPLIGCQGVIGIVSRGGAGVTVFVSLDKINSLIERVAEKLRDEE
jgi:hypothetical protein